MQNIIKIHAWAEPYVNFILGETSPLTFSGKKHSGIIPSMSNTSDQAKRVQTVS